MNRIILRHPKTCSCGIRHIATTASGRRCDALHLWFECSCGSTLVEISEAAYAAREARRAAELELANSLALKEASLERLRAWERSYRAVQLTGRCANGAERDRGRRAHALPHGSYYALCGATYGKRSAGWSTYDEPEVNCPRCLKKMEQKVRMNG